MAGDCCGHKLELSALSLPVDAALMLLPKSLLLSNTILMIVLSLLRGKGGWLGPRRLLWQGGQAGDEQQRPGRHAQQLAALHADGGA